MGKIWVGGTSECCAALLSSFGWGIGSPRAGWTASDAALLDHARGWRPSGCWWFSSALFRAGLPEKSGHLLRCSCMHDSNRPRICGMRGFDKGIRNTLTTITAYHP
ncbi:hypothetical protein K461DRAFT_272958, partial [Myriangium duriaei CBS 260.36]